MSNNKLLRQVNKTIVVAIMLIVALALLFLWLMYGGHNCWLSGYGDILSGIAAMVSGVLLYVTLGFQNRSFKQERFEITFYNLLNQRRIIIESVFFKCEDLNGALFKQKKYQGELAFVKAWRDIEYMYKSLSSSRYIGAMDEEDEYNNILNYLNTPPVDDMVNNAQDYCYCKRVNYTYDITKKTYDEIRCAIDELEKCKRCYEILLNHKSFATERYFRFLSIILSLLEEVKEEKYCKILLAQMSKEELQIINCQALIDEEFYICLANAEIIKLLENEFVFANK